MPKVPFLRWVVQQTRAVRSAGLVIFRGDVLLSMDRLRRSAVADAEDVGEEGRGSWLCSQGSGMAAGRSASDDFMGQLEDLEFPRVPFFVGRMSRSSPPSDSVAAQRVIDLGVGNAANVATWAGLGVPSPRIGSHCVPTSGVNVFFRWEMRDVSVVDVRVIRYPGVREVGGCCPSGPPPPVVIWVSPSSGAGWGRVPLGSAGGVCGRCFRRDSVVGGWPGFV
eukprot:COSAG01_NODE_15366_length_1343_cov_1.190858_2_plen_222_part_00